MDSGRITLGFLLIVMVAVGLFFGITRAPSAYAATNANVTTYASVLVNGFVSVTLFGVPIYFPSMDPGTNNTQANVSNGWPMIVQVDPTTNAASMILLNATNFTSGSNGFIVGNMSFNVTKSATATANASCAPGAGTVAPCNYSLAPMWVFNETARLGAGANSSIYNWMDVPSTQAPGVYLNNVRVCIQQAGVGGC